MSKEFWEELTRKLPKTPPPYDRRIRDPIIYGTIYVALLQRYDIVPRWIRKQSFSTNRLIHTLNNLEYHSHAFFPVAIKPRWRDEYDVYGWRMYDWSEKYRARLRCTVPEDVDPQVPAEKQPPIGAIQTPTFILLSPQ